MDVQKSHSWNLQSRIASLLQKRSSSDVEFQVGTPSRQFFGHKVILAAGSPVFETMFFGDVGQSNPVYVPDVTAEGFAVLLQYLYTDTATLRDEIEAFDAAYAAKKYMVASLFSLCEGFLLKHCSMDPESVFDTYELASVLEMTRLQNHCLRFISRRAQTVLSSSTFRKASRGTFLDILRVDLLSIDTELDVIEALLSWSKDQSKESGDDDCSIENVLEHTRELMKYVRFFDLEEEEVLNLAEMCGLICFPGPRKAMSDVPAKPKKRSISTATKVGLPVDYRYDGSMGSFVVENRQCTIDMKVKGPPVTIMGVTIAFKTIPCYSLPDRFLEVKISVADPSCDRRSVVEGRFDPKCPGDDEEQHFLLLDEYLLVEEDQPMTVTMTTRGEGVRLMQCTEDEVRCKNGESVIVLTFDRDGASEGGVTTVPIKEILIA